ncbi:Cupredoxin [Camillea tinctor]|nr:Cupredoxin [Camillea tinctor]
MHRTWITTLTTSFLAVGSWAATVKYDWEITWVNASPDGFVRPVIGINGKWPCPVIEANVGDTIVVNLTNRLGNETTGLHFHGIKQTNTNFMDGAVGANQCPVPPNATFTYCFLADTPGTYWYHSHNMGQYPDGLRGPLIIHDRHDPYSSYFDEDVTLTVSDWYHDESITLVRQMLQPNNTDFLIPTPDSVIVNEGRDGIIYVEPGKSYRVRVINFSAFAAAFITFGDLPMNVIMTDGTYVEEETNIKQLRITPAQRYDVILNIGSNALGSNESSTLLPYLVVLDVNPDYTNTSAELDWPYNFTGALTQHHTPLDAKPVPLEVDSFDPFDDARFAALDRQAAWGPVTAHWVLNFDFCADANGIPRACFNGTTYLEQKVPTLYSAATLGRANVQPSAYGQVNPFVARRGDVLEIVLNNHDPALHPFHLHGHQFQVIERPYSGAGDWRRTRAPPDVEAPVRRDTVGVFGNSYAVLRIVVDNPGVFLFHCHIEWHVEMGLTATLIEAPDRLVGYPIPQQHLDVCKSIGIPTSGNAAGHKAWWDHEGFVTVPPTVYNGSVRASRLSSAI